MSSKPAKQHYVPRVYLKQFRIDESQNSGFTYCLDLRDPYRKYIQKVGLNDSLFTFKKYYNHANLVEPFALERLFAKEYEPTYPNIISHINQGGTLSKLVRQQLMEWIFVSKMRSPAFRENHERLIRFVSKTTNAYQGKPDEPLDEAAVRDQAKWRHLSTFIEPVKLERTITQFFSALNTKQWRILKATNNQQFIGCDNPGFSPNLHPSFRRQTPFHHLTELNAHSVIYFTLSPLYCLEISPFKEGTDLTVCAMTMDIPFEEATPTEVQFINIGTAYTAYKLVFSPSIDLLGSMFKIESR